MSSPTSTKVETTFGTIAVTSAGPTTGEDSSGDSHPALLLIHGNSFCSKIFRHILASPAVTSSRRVLAIDLPGHGDSSDARDPEAQYTQPAYARCAVEVLRQLGVRRVVVLGWSLGGHVGIEMLPLTAKGAPVETVGLMMVGSPPVAHGELDKGFNLPEDNWEDSFAARDDLSKEEIDLFAHNVTDPPYEDWMLDAVSRTDQKARRIMFRAFNRGEGLDQRKMMDATDVPVAIVNGAEEPFIKLDFFDGVKFRNLWRGECIRLPGLKHASFWAKPKEFEDLLVAFLADCDKYAGAT